MRQQLGVFLQLAVLMFLPLLIGFQLFFGMPLVVMPVLTLVAIALFTGGYFLRKP